MFYSFRQNNSGGNFYGPVIVCVECDSVEEANEIAQQHDVYFDGVDEEVDCQCCGDRWSRAWRDEALTEIPMVYDEPLKQQKLFYKIIYKNGTIEEGGSTECSWE